MSDTTQEAVQFTGFILSPENDHWRIPKGVRLLRIGSEIIRVPIDATHTKIYVHPDDMHLITEANT